MDKLLAKLAEMQKECAPIKLSIGYVSDSGQVRHDAIVIHDAPPVVITTLADDKTLMFYLDESVGLMVRSLDWNKR